MTTENPTPPILPQPRPPTLPNVPSRVFTPPTRRPSSPLPPMQSLQHGMPAYHHSLPVHTSQEHSYAPMNQHHITHDGFQSDQSHLTQAQRNSPPRYDSLPPAFPSQSQSSYSYQPTDRSLPSRNVSEEDFADAYAQFILYCNPHFPTSTGTTELKRAFNTPSKSENKLFRTYYLFELITKFESGEIKTWNKLAEMLGVEKPDLQKGQSAQKVQQYSVRLKRWMKAMHIPAFFQYINGKMPQYALEIPSPNSPLPRFRDETSLEEDLALRSLDPSLKPKRGRRKLDDFDDDMEPQSAVEPKRPQLDTAFISHPQSAYPASAVPFSAHPDQGSYNRDDLFAQAMKDGHSRWRLNTDVQSSHPMSAVTPMSGHPDFDEPQSAITPRMKSRRRHGPAVSSAWSGSSTTPNGKMRGRPPRDRSVQAGPFNTFPANPQRERSSSANFDESRLLTPMDYERSTASTPEPAGNAPSASTRSNEVNGATMAQVAPPAPMQPQGRPEKLALTIPQNRSTPTLLVNGELSSQSGQMRAPPQPYNAMSSSLPTPTPSTTSSLAFSAASATSYRSSAFSLPSASTDHDSSAPYLTPRSSNAMHAPKSFSRDIPTSQPMQQFTPVTPERIPLRSRAAENELQPIAHDQSCATAGLATETLKRLLAADLLRADLDGRRKRLRGNEAKALAEAALTRIGVRMESHASSATRSVQEHRNITVATWLGLQLNAYDCTGSFDSILTASASRSGASPKKIAIHRFRTNTDGYDSPADDEDSGDESGDVPMSRSHGRLKKIFDISWSSDFGGITGSFQIRSLELDSGLDAHQDIDRQNELSAIDEEDENRTADEQELAKWKARALAAEEKIKGSRNDVERWRERVLDVVLGSS